MKKVKEHTQNESILLFLHILRNQVKTSSKTKKGTIRKLFTSHTITTPYTHPKAFNLTKRIKAIQQFRGKIAEKLKNLAKKSNFLRKYTNKKLNQTKIPD